MLMEETRRNSTTGTIKTIKKWTEEKASFLLRLFLLLSPVENAFGEKGKEDLQGQIGQGEEFAVMGIFGAVKMPVLKSQVFCFKAQAAEGLGKQKRC